jgi:periplasmic divalent cation tolerance protein
METAQTLLILTNLPDEASARRLAARLVDDRLAACVSIMAPCTSVYRWQGAVEETREIPLLIKSSAERYPALETAIRANHPYELPEIVAVTIARGLPDYLNWVVAETSPTAPESPPAC